MIQRVPRCRSRICGDEIHGEVRKLCDLTTVSLGFDTRACRSGTILRAFRAVHQLLLLLVEKNVVMVLRPLDVNIRSHYATWVCHVWSSHRY